MTKKNNNNKSLYIIINNIKTNFFYSVEIKNEHCIQLCVEKNVLYIFREK